MDVEVDIRTPNEEDATKQAEAIEALTGRADGIAISCSDANTVIEALKWQVEQTEELPPDTRYRERLC